MIEQERLHLMWASVADAWGRQADAVDARSAELTARMLELAAPAPGERVVDLAAGPGGAGLAAAALVGPYGEVVLSDVAPEMVEIAATRARRAGLENVTTRVLDLEAIDEPDGSFDVVLCREGLMLVGDPGRAAAEMRRVLRPGGRAAIAVWAGVEHNPWLGLIAASLSAELGQPVPPPGTPHPFSLGGEGQLEDVLTGAGLVDVRVEELAVPYRGASAEDWWESRIGLAGPLAQRVRTLQPEVLAAARARALEAARAFETPDGIELPGLCLVACARR
jgi:ubiquinone/menaquinone biosynthesis C-methylase UbiE